MRPLTARQQEVLELLKRHLETTGMPPTRAEISRELGFKSPNAAEEHLKALARKGAIEIVAGLLAVFALLMTVQMMRKKKAYRSSVVWLGSQFWLSNILKVLIVLMLICLSLKLISY